MLSGADVRAAENEPPPTIFDQAKSPSIKDWKKYFSEFRGSFSSISCVVQKEKNEYRHLV